MGLISGGRGKLLFACLVLRQPDASGCRKIMKVLWRRTSGGLPYP